MVSALLTPLTRLHEKHNGNLQAMMDKFAVNSKGIEYKIKVLRLLAFPFALTLLFLRAGTLF